MHGDRLAIEFINFSLKAYFAGFMATNTKVSDNESENFIIFPWSSEHP